MSCYVEARAKFGHIDRTIVTFDFGHVWRTALGNPSDEGLDIMLQ